MRAQAIVTELDVTLDREYELSEGLAQMYEYMNRRLMEANLEKDTEILKEVLTYSETLRDTWKEAMTLSR
jgi:flagellar protein FliS